MKNRVGIILLINPYLHTGNFLSRQSEELKKLLMTKMDGGCSRRVSSSCPNAVSQGLSVGWGALAWGHESGQQLRVLWTGLWMPGSRSCPVGLWGIEEGLE